MAVREDLHRNRWEKLIALARDPNATEAERSTAAAKARALQMRGRQLVVVGRSREPAIVRRYIEIMRDTA